jgi:NAD(P)-dependent dehydrogenase (short-subunit alcohol dehydrogenase family)
MQNSYTNKIVLVTGGTYGIGKTLIAFADAGARVVLTGRREKEGLEIVAEIKKTGGTAAYIRTDVAKEADVVKAVSTSRSTMPVSKSWVRWIKSPKNNIDEPLTLTSGGFSMP